jgi:predicted GIY-YIG superfamily endonuclease
MDSMSFWVYILKCSDGSYYTGHTDDLNKRLWQHENCDEGSYVYSRRPFTLVFSETFNSRTESKASEKQIKGWSRRKKEALIRGDWEEISRLAKSHKDKTTS